MISFCLCTTSFQSRGVNITDKCFSFLSEESCSPSPLLSNYQEFPLFDLHLLQSQAGVDSEPGEHPSSCVKTAKLVVASEMCEVRGKRWKTPGELSCFQISLAYS